MSKLRASPEFAEKLNKIELSINADPSRAMRELRALYKLASAADEPEAFTVYCELLIGRCHQRRGRLSDAHKQISKSTRRLDALGAAREAATGYHYLSQINSARHDMQSALECCMRGREIAKRSRDWYLLMNFEIDMGPISRSMGDMRAAVDAYVRGQDIYYKHVKGKDARIKGQEDYTEFIIALNVAIQYYNLKELSKAKECLGSIAGREQLVLNGAYIDLYHLECGRVCFGLNLRDEGVAHADVVINRLEESDKRSLHSAHSNYLGLSDDLIKNGEADRGWKLISLVKPHIERDSSPRTMGILSFVLAEYYHATNQLEEAARCYKEYAKYMEDTEARETEENRVSIYRRMELQKSLDRRHQADVARARQLETMRQQMEYRAEREEILTNISENTDSFFLLYNPAARSVDFVSQNSVRLFGFDVSESGDPCQSIIEWLDMPSERAGKFMSGEIEERFSADYTARNRSTGAPMTIHQELIPSKIRSYIMVLTDVTREKETHASLITAIEAARQASNAKTMFLSNMSHDIRTPLNVVVGLIDMLEENILNPTVAREYISNIRHSARHLLDLINDMLDMSRIEAGRMELSEEEFTMPEFLESVMAIMRPQALARAQKLTLDARGVGDHALVSDPLHLRQAFINILSNAVKFTPTGGQIKLTARQTRARRDDIDYWFEFSDTGCGMPPEFLARVFNPFERADREVRTIEGTGLGMAITKSIVDMMNGTIDVKSELNAGTVFTLKLTIKRKSKLPNDDSEPTPDTALKPRQAIKGKVLLVDDNPLNRDIARHLLDKLGVESATAENGQQALDMVSAAAVGEYALVFMDVRMPVLNGYEATKRIRALDRPDALTLPIVAMTADAFKEDVRMALASGMNAHIAKPLDVRAVEDALYKYMPSE